MPPGRKPKHKALFARRWIHVFEEDGAEGAVFRPDATDIPLSRRPREVLELDPDGTARIGSGGQDDRVELQAATWREEGAEVVIRDVRTGADRYRIVACSPDRLVAREGGG